VCAVCHLFPLFGLNNTDIITTDRYPVYGEWRKDPDTGADYFICEGCIDD